MHLGQPAACAEATDHRMDVRDALTGVVGVRMTANGSLTLASLLGARLPLDRAAQERLFEITA